MNHTHTKGPWRSIQNFADEAEDERIIIEDKDGNTIAEITHGGLEWEEYEGNARLIAAAPALLEALEDLLAYWDIAGDVCQFCGRDYSGEEETLQFCQSDDCPGVKGRQALAKATGDHQAIGTNHEEGAQ